MEPFIPTGSTNDFLLFQPFIISVFVQHERTKVVTSHLFTPLFMFIHLSCLTSRLRLFYWSTLNSKWLTYFCILLCICHCFSHLNGLFSVTWLSLLYKFTRFFIYFLLLSDVQGPTVETLNFTVFIYVNVTAAFRKNNYQLLTLKFGNNSKNLLKPRVSSNKNS